MQQTRGVWLPAGDIHMRGQIARSPVVAGKPTYQYPKLLAAMAHVKTRNLAVDVGAHVGLWAYQLSKLFARVEAFEPMPQHLECLQRNLGLAANVRVHAVALGTRTGSVFMQAAQKNSGESWILPDARAGQGVTLAKLDDFNLADVGLLKLDCEGYEYFALRGALETIERCRPVIVVEQHEASAVRYGIPHLAGRDLLLKHGYKEVRQMTVDHIMVPT